MRISNTKASCDARRMLGLCEVSTSWHPLHASRMGTGRAHLQWRWRWLSAETCLERPCLLRPCSAGAQRLSPPGSVVRSSAETAIRAHFWGLGREQKVQRVSSALLRRVLLHPGLPWRHHESGRERRLRQPARDRWLETSIDRRVRCPEGVVRELYYMVRSSPALECPRECVESPFARAHQQQRCQSAIVQQSQPVLCVRSG